MITREQIVAHLDRWQKATQSVDARLNELAILTGSDQDGPIFGAVDRLQLAMTHQLAELDGKSEQYRCDCVVFSILNVIDGCSGGFGASIDLALRTHPDDKAYHIENDDDWYENGQVINDDCMLHELYYKRGGDEAIQELKP